MQLTKIIGLFLLIYFHIVADEMSEEVVFTVPGERVMVSVWRTTFIAIDYHLSCVDPMIKIKTKCQ